MDDGKARGEPRVRRFYEPEDEDWNVTDTYSRI
jgi:hypothetical protein